MNHLKNSLVKTLALFILPALACAGEFTLGAQFQGWSSDYLPPANIGGWEIWSPISMNFDLDKGINLYAQSEFGNGSYTNVDGTGAGGTINLSGFSDTVVGSQLSFKSFGVPSILNLGVNVPTGDQTWEAKQVGANLPSQFVDTRYRGRGFGVSGFYGLSLPAGGGAEFGAAAGYLYAGAFNPNYGITGLASDSLKLGDSLFLSLNHVQPFSGNQNEVIRFSAFTFLPTQFDSANVFQMGPNLNASYGWSNPAALSFELGGQYYFAGQRLDATGNFAAEPHNSYGPRFYFVPSYAFGDFTVAARAKYVMANGYGVNDVLYNACVPGFLFGIQPSYKLKLDSQSALNLTASCDYIVAQNAGLAADLITKTDVTYTRFTFGTNYEIKL